MSPTINASGSLYPSHSSLVLFKLFKVNGLRYPLRGQFLTSTFMVAP